jgi:hypothetical protein
LPDYALEFVDFVLFAERIEAKYGGAALIYVDP